MTNKQTETADQLLKLLTEHSGYLDKDQLWFFLVKDFEEEVPDKWTEISFTISIMEEKNLLEWLPGGHKLKIKSAGLKASEIGVRQYGQEQLDRERNKYLKVENSNINFGVNNGEQSVNQGSFLRESQMVNNPPKTETKIIKEISIGLIVTVIGGLIIYLLTHWK